MSDLIVVTYPDLHRAGEVYAALQRLQNEFPIDIEDAAYVTKELDGKLKLHQTIPIAAASASIGMARGTLWRTLIGLLFLDPFAGMAPGALFGAAGGAVAGSPTGSGIPDSFMKELEEKVRPGTSALLVPIRKATIDKVLGRVAQYGGTLMHSSLSPEAGAHLQAALDRGGASRSAA